MKYLLILSILFISGCGYLNRIATSMENIEKYMIEKKGLSPYHIISDSAPSNIPQDIKVYQVTKDNDNIKEELKYRLN